MFNHFKQENTGPSFTLEQIKSDAVLENISETVCVEDARAALGHYPPTLPPTPQVTSTQLSHYPQSSSPLMEHHYPPSSTTPLSQTNYPPPPPTSGDWHGGGILKQRIVKRGPKRGKVDITQ